VKLPPLNSLRAFEASARALSFTKAAEELCVTQGAVSRHVQILERYLGVPLFVRLTRQLKLTREGEMLFGVASGCFSNLSAVTAAIRAERQREVLTVRLPPYLSARWLFPQLGRFVAAHPSVDLRLSHATGEPDFVKTHIDLAVYWGDNEWPGLVTERFLTFRRVPMCSPSLLRGPPPLRCYQDLLNVPLLHEFDHRDWERWYEAAGLRPSDAARGTVVDNYDVLVQAAVDGQGVALIAVPLLADHLQTGRLVLPFGPNVGTELQYNLVYPVASLARPIVKAFRDWLLTLAPVVFDEQQMLRHVCARRAAEPSGLACGNA
jgi:LysR family glycine cleavage system transcriptional activator